MADHLISLTNKQENALLDLLAERQAVDPAATADGLLKKWVLVPIRARIEDLDAARVQPIVAVLPDATNAQLTSIKTILGIS